MFGPAEKFLTDDCIVVNRLPVTDHDLTMAEDTVYEQIERLGWTVDKDTETGADS